MVPDLIRHLIGQLGTAVVHGEQNRRDQQVRVQVLLDHVDVAQQLAQSLQCEYYALEGLGQLLKNINLIKEHLNPDLLVSTILLTMYDGRTKLADQVANEVRNHFGDMVLRTTIPRSVKVSEAPGFGQSVMTYDPGSRGAMSYLDAAREIAERGTKEQA